MEWMHIAVPILAAGFFSLVGFVWRFSHKVTRIENQVLDLRRRVALMEAAHDKALDRIYSMAKSRAMMRP
jgi:hypothetical protein